MNTSEIQATVTASAPATPQNAAVHSGVTFHDVLSAINPLQYIPIVGTIYRAVTGDVIPEAVREAGSLLVSGLLGGPIGLITNIAMTIGEKITGIDPEKIAAAHLSNVSPQGAQAVGGSASAPAPSSVATGSPVPAPAATSLQSTSAAPATLPDENILALSPQQLSSYGVHTDASGTLRLGDAEGADALNAVELIRLGNAAAAYAATQSRQSAPPFAGNV